MRFTRRIFVEKIVIAVGESLSAALDFSQYAGGILINSGTDWTTADLCFEVSDTLSGTYVKLRDSSGVLIRVTGLSTTAGEARPLPEELFAAGFVKLRSVNTASEAAVNQVATQTIKLVLKP